MTTNTIDVNTHLIVGLGNPGRRYANTRHNVGFRCVDLLADRHRLQIGHRHGDAIIGTGDICGTRVVLAKPQTYMNLSGRSVRSLLSWFKLTPRQLIVVYDDMDLTLGRIRLRASGSSGGHRGVQSIIDVLGSNEFPRVRVGIGRPLREDAIEHVLQPFTGDEEHIVQFAYGTAADAIECILSEGLTAAMNKFNRETTTS